MTATMPLTQQASLLSLEEQAGRHDRRTAVLEALGSPEPRLRAWALLAAPPASDDTEVTSALVRCLGDTNESVRYAALLCAARNRLPVSHDALQALLSDESHRIRALAAAEAPAICPDITPADLDALIGDSHEPAWRAAERALLSLRGENPDSVFSACPDELFTRETVKRVLPCTVLPGEPPPVDGWDAEWPEDGGVASAFLVRGMLEGQGLFTFRAGQTADPQTVVNAVAWRSTFGVSVVAYGAVQDRDYLTFHVGTAADENLPGTWHSWTVRPDGNCEGSQGAPPAQFASRIGDDRWECRAYLPLPAEALPGGTMLFNVGRQSGLHATGFGVSHSSWNYTCNTFDCHETAGDIVFTEAPVWVEIRPLGPAWAPDRDRFSVEHEHMGIASPGSPDTLPHLAPLYLTPGDNRFIVSTDADMPLSLFVGAISTKRNAVFFPTAVPAGAHDVEVTLTLEGDHTEAREWLVMVDVADAATGQVVQRISLDRVPLVSPHQEPLREVSPGIAEQATQPKRTRRSTGDVIEDLGPLALGESYPMGIAWGADGRFYGGTFPSGRLYAYDPASDVVEDVGNPCEPHNHLETVFSGPNGIIYFGFARPEGRLGCYDPANGALEDLGVPVPGAIGGDCHVAAATADAVWGFQRGHLWNYHWKTGVLTSTGPFVLDDGRVAPVWQARAPLGPNPSWLAVCAGGRLGWCTVFGRDVLRATLTDVVVTGRLLHGRGGSPCLAQASGEVLAVNPKEDALALLWQTDGAGIAPETPMAMADDGVIFRIEHSRAEGTVARLWAHEPGEQAARLIGPLPRDAQYGPALAIGPDGTVTGVSARRVYGAGRDTARLWRLRR